MKRKLAKLSQIDFEDLGYRTMQQVGDEMAAKGICVLEIHAYAHAIQPQIADVIEETEHVRNRRQSLWMHLYDREPPVNDAAMLAQAIKAGILGVLVVVTAFASMATHTMMFNLTGSWLGVSVLLGVALTSFTMVVGYRAYETILLSNKVAEAIVSTVAFVLLFWGLFQIAQARGTLMEKLTTPAVTSSFVESNGADDVPQGPVQAEPSIEAKVRSFLSGGQMKIMLAADLIVGIFLGLLVEKWTDEDFVAWQKLKRMSRELRKLVRRTNGLLGSIEIAKKRCMVGLLRAKYRRHKRHVPYHRALPLLLVSLLLLASPTFGQTIARHEAILIDVSGSIGKGGPNSELFRDYLVGVKKLLLTEPPQTRVWVSTITTDSFGSVGSILEGWTPEVHGVLDDDLNRARHQLAAGFESKSSGLRPAAAGTDIIGSLWYTKALVESRTQAGTVPTTIWILSDMMNESASLNMPALVSLGPDKMLMRAKANGLVVPLPEYQVHVIGVSPAGLTPKAWNTLRLFWTLYFREAGAQLISYSAETAVERD